VIDLDPKTWTFSVKKSLFKKTVLPEKPVKKPVFNLPAGFFKPWMA
jgi:hypothetical protein